MDTAEDILRSASGKDIIELIFKKFIYCLKKEIVGVYRIKNFKFRGKDLDGLLYEEKIYLEHYRARKYLTQVLIHELSHYIFDNYRKSEKQNEKIVCQLEMLLSEMFSERQKAALSKFIPRHASNEVPK